MDENWLPSIAPMVFVCIVKAQSGIQATPNSFRNLRGFADDSSGAPDLRKAHQANDKAVMQAYGFDVKTMTEASCVAELMKRYQELTRSQE